MESVDNWVYNNRRLMKAIGADLLFQKIEDLETRGTGIFQPTLTSGALLLQALRLVEKDSAVLDLGCGWGVIGLEIGLKLDGNLALSMSDLSENAVASTIRNSEILKLDSVVKVGSLFEPWKGSKFDLIICDVSGVSEKVPFLEKWFHEIPCAAGNDGLNLVTEVIRESHEYLIDQKASLLLPLISLSDISKGEELMKNAFESVELLSETSWFLDIDENYEETMHDLRKLRLVDFKKVDSKYQFFTRIYKLTNPILRQRIQLEKRFKNDK